MIINWAYVGGFFDGEGSIHIDGNCIHPIFSQQHLPTLENIANFMQAEGIQCKIYDTRHNNSTYQIGVSTKRDNITKFLSKIIPYVTMKRRVVQDAIRYQKLFPKMPMGPRS